MIEKYESKEGYYKNIELIKNNDEKMMIYYKKSKLKDEVYVKASSLIFINK